MEFLSFFSVNKLGEYVPFAFNHFTVARIKMLLQLNGLLCLLLVLFSSLDNFQFCVDQIRIARVGCPVDLRYGFNLLLTESFFLQKNERSLCRTAGCPSKNSN